MDEKILQWMQSGVKLSKGMFLLHQGDEAAPRMKQKCGKVIRQLHKQHRCIAIHCRHTEGGIYTDNNMATISSRRCLPLLMCTLIIHADIKFPTCTDSLCEIAAVH